MTTWNADFYREDNRMAEVKSEKTVNKNKLYQIFKGPEMVNEWNEVCEKFRKVQWAKKGGRKLTLPDANKVQKDE